MDIRPLDPPRTFTVGDPPLELSHMADVELGADEQVTFVTESGTELDVCRKSWGYYGTPSLNRRLPAHGLRPALSLSKGGLFVLLVEPDKEDEFQAYIDKQGMKLICWLDTDEAVERLVDNMGGDES